MNSVSPIYGPLSSSSPTFPSPQPSMPVPVHYGAATPPESYYLGTPVLTSTIPPRLPEYSPDDDVTAIRNACHGAGTDDKDLVKVLVAKSSKQMQILEFAYKSQRRKDLLQRLKSETSGIYKTSLVLLASGALEGDAYALSQALKPENKEDKLAILAELVVARSKPELALLRNYLLATRQTNLEDAVLRAVAKESKTVQAIFAESLKPELPAEPADVKQDFLTLRRLIVGNSKQSDAILPILLSRPLPHLNQLAEHWCRENFNTRLEVSISLHLTNDNNARDLLLYALGSAERSQGYGVWRDAELIEDALSRKRHLLLAVRLIRAHWDQIRFQQIIATCDNIKPGKGTLKKRVKSSTSGDLEYLLAKVIKQAVL